MSDLQALYQELIIDHGRSPRNFGKLEPADLMHEGFNPLCGDKITIYLRHSAGQVQLAKFEGCGCAISMASASLLTELLPGKTAAEIKAIFNDFHALVTGAAHSKDPAALGKLNALAGVAAFPMRVKCATLAWHTVLAALGDSSHLN